MRYRLPKATRRAVRQEVAEQASTMTAQTLNTLIAKGLSELSKLQKRVAVLQERLDVYSTYKCLAEDRERL